MTDGDELKSGLKKKHLLDQDLECCSQLTATLKESRSGEHTLVSGREFHWTKASGKEEYL